MNSYKVYDKTENLWALNDEGFNAWSETWDAPQIDVGTPIIEKVRTMDLSDFIAQIMEKLDGLSDEDLDFQDPDFRF